MLNLTAVVKASSVVLTWSPPQEPNGVIIAYEVSYSVNNNSTTINTTGINTMLVIEVQPSTTVAHISVLAYTSIGPGNASIHRDVSILQQNIMQSKYHRFSSLILESSIDHLLDKQRLH